MPLPAPFILLSLPLLMSCANKNRVKQRDPTPFNVSDFVQPVPNLYLRTAFDKDPSMYLGRFIPDGVEPIDETSARQTQCSKFIKHRYIEAGGRMDQVFTSSTGAALNVSIPPIVGVGGGGKGSTYVRGSYEFTGKLVAEVPNEDLEAFEECCFKAADLCSQRFIGEFIEGTGGVYQALGREADGGADVAAMVGEAGSLPLDIGAEASRGVMWQRSAQFDKLYFAMKSSLAPVDTSFPACGSWMDGEVPTSTFGMYFVGVGDLLPNERDARNSAMFDSYSQIIKWLGVEITDIRSTFEGDRVSEGTSGGKAKRVVQRSECVEEVKTPDGLHFKTKVLAYIPNSALDEIGK